MKKVIPVNIISGSLGVGKTTMINHLLKQRPPHEYWSILVNEYGLVGIDAALMSSDFKQSEKNKVKIKEVAGGCICCSAGFIFEVSLIQLLQRRPDRLLIEPTGLAALSGILDTLQREGIREAVDLRSIICLLDVNTLPEALECEEVMDQIEAADILLASRPDLATEKGLELFHTMANSLYPPKVFIGSSSYGQMSLEQLDLISSRESAVQSREQLHGTDHYADLSKDKGHSPLELIESGKLIPSVAQPILRQLHHSNMTSTIGWVCWADLVFDARQISDWLKKLLDLPNTLRIKAVLRTSEGWWLFNFTKETETQWPSSYRRDSRLEVIIKGGILLDPLKLEDELRSCLCNH